MAAAALAEARMILAGIERSIYQQQGEIVAPVRVLSQPPVRLFLTATSLLFVELLLIRWIPANVIYIGFFRNFLLMASFLGIGVGILWGRDPRRVPLSPFGPLLLGLVILVTQFQVSIKLTSPDEIFFGLSESQGADINFLVLPGVVLIATMIMAGLAVPLGGLLRAMPPLKAYRVDIAGSMTGIAIFTLLSATGTPPIVWFSVVAVLVSLLGLGVGLSRRSLVTAGSLAAVLAIVGLGMPAGQVWSPYYRVDEYPSKGVDAINVNGIPHQAMWPVDRPIYPFYEQVYRWFPERTYENVLIVGAGSGTDVAVALKHGARHIDAVEIDARIQEIGVRDHPNRPYDDPRVTRINDDGRAFLRRTTNRYDLVVFALPDSLTLVSTSANLRLESFLFTSEAFNEVRDRLSPDGVFVLYNFYREDWLPQKIAGMLEGSFGSPPIVRIHGSTAATLAAGPLVAGLNGAPPPGDQVDAVDVAGAPAAATDDWPFLYLKDHFIAPYYGLAIGIIIAFAVLLVARAAVRSGTSVRQFSPHFFVLGVAFLLLETKSIATFSLLFGTTWVVNSLVFFAVLASVLAAILVNQRVRFRNPVWLYAGLFGSLALAIALPPAQLLLDPPWLRYVVAAALAFAPIFFANLVFSYSFRDTKAADMAFASNLLGAVVGGAVEYVALVSGYSWLLFLVGGLYLLAWALASNVRLLADVGLTSPTTAGAPGTSGASLSQVEVPQ
jgi:Spermine/spermidine synthase domain